MVGASLLTVSFRFKEFWVFEPDCRAVIQLAWNQVCSGSPAMKLCNKICFLKVALKSSNRSRIGNIQANFARLSLSLESIQQDYASGDNCVLEMHV